MGGFLILLGLVLLAVSIAVAIKPRPRLGMKSRWLALPLLLGSIVSCSIGLPPVDEPSADKPAVTLNEAVTKPVSIKAADKTIERVEISPPNLILQSYIAEPSSQPIMQAGMVAVRVARRIQSGAPEDSKNIEYVLLSYEVAGHDRLGNNTRIDYMNLVLPAEDLRAANLLNLGWIGVLNLAHEVSFGSRIGADDAEAWCEENLDVARPFCSKALR